MTRHLDLRVLIVDDYVDAAESLALLLRLHGYQTAWESDGTRALEKADAWRPAACIVDLVMPTLDGWTFARRMRSRSWARSTLLIAYSGRSGPGWLEQAREAGFHHVVCKPANIGVLARLIDTQRSMAEKVSG